MYTVDIVICIINIIAISAAIASILYATEKSLPEAIEIILNRVFRKITRTPWEFVIESIATTTLLVIGYSCGMTVWSLFVAGSAIFFFTVFRKWKIMW